MLAFWARLCSGDKHKISNTIYSLLYTLDEKYIFKSEWVETVKTILNQSLPCSIDKIRLKDKFI